MRHGASTPAGGIGTALRIFLLTAYRSVRIGFNSDMGCGSGDYYFER